MRSGPIETADRFRAIERGSEVAGVVVGRIRGTPTYRIVSEWRIFDITSRRNPNPRVPNYRVIRTFSDQTDQNQCIFLRVIRLFG